ncbi:hypothetical protein CFC21_009328 [Triticum aestivum]|uniref:Uncharacterized protein n=2 Tax=Triticum aestivum TaxID=4565 RepID=A0A9R1DIZ4_WHEAT|nr:uncharacterized protein LOC123148654 isoform X1 [Triticum aestivum]XP_044424076.1 uncharacterized protein LOC123148654 isoform X1 [Triticum aestivum]XP_044424085.1 uncharacterized protein LOC123148654 isoform X1 [Triticum aestivum]XP_044424089.1 uncharacterized protein LOC123148654 isoform X1 [Triticum aestivum]XP_044424098.1 uncharacterized protein LOC123148654 isoform X1 [Triticum aestivum]KAF6992322.1 hypothetical protein CFC21_009328 [Triticum aestivum]
MCGCAEALVRAVVAFYDAFLVDCFVFWFRRRRPRPGPDSPASAHRDPLVPKDWTGEALPASDEEKGFAESTLSNQQLADGDDTDEELRREVIVVKAVTGRRGGFGTRPMIESMLSPPWKDLFSLMIVLKWQTM